MPKRKPKRLFKIYSLIVIIGNFLSIKPGYPSDLSSFLCVLGYSLQGLSIIWEVIGIYAIYFYRVPDKPWNKSLEEYCSIFEREISNKRMSQGINFGVATISKALKLLVIIFLTLAILVIGVMLKWWPDSVNRFLWPYISPYHRWEIPIVFLALIFCLLCMWNLRSQQRRILNKRVVHMREAMSRLRSQAVINGNTEYKNQVRTLIKDIIRLALESTRYGIHKKLARVFYLNRSVGPKSVWLFLPESDKGYFTIAEYYCDEGGCNAYEKLPEHYHPKILDLKGWKSLCSKKKKDLAHGAAGREKEIKQELFALRCRYGSDLGVIAKHELGEYLWSIDAKCRMHDYSYLEHIGLSYRKSHRFRSCIVLPIPYNNITSGHETFPLLALYSPAEAEFDLRDYMTLWFYADALAILIAHYERHWGPYPLQHSR